MSIQHDTPSIRRRPPQVERRAETNLYFRRSSDRQDETVESDESPDHQRKRAELSYLIIGVDCTAGTRSRTRSRELSLTSIVRTFCGNGGGSYDGDHTSYPEVTLADVADIL